MMEWRLNSSSMRRIVDTYNCVEGFHHYPDAPEKCAYLADIHRHMFVIRCGFEVSHNNREIEINTQQNLISDFLARKYGTPCQFGAMSCEDIAECIIGEFDCVSCQVLEDNYGGATLSR